MTMQIYDVFKTSHDFDPGKPALVINEQTYSASELSALVEETAATLTDFGCAKGDIILCALSNNVTHCALLLAASKLNLALASIDPMTPEKTIDQFRSQFRPAVSILEARHPRAESSDTFINSVSEAVVSHILEEEEKKQAQGCFILCTTSGSTGRPKPIILSQETKIKRASIAAAHYELDESSIVLASTPLHHTLAQRLFFLPMILGGTSVIMDQFSVNHWIDTISRWNVSFTIAVSSQLTRILETAMADPQGFLEKTNSLQNLVASSSRCSDATKEQLVKAFKCPVHEIYGASEVATISNINITDDWDNRRSVGLPVKGVKIKILDEAHNELPLESTGEIAVKSEQIYSGYFGVPDLTNQSFINDYFLTGDLGHLDKNGYLTFQGRTRELVKTGGISVYPIDIEDAAVEIDSVIEACCFGVPDRMMGEVCCLLVTTNNADDNLRRVLRRGLLKVLAPHQQPKYVEIVSEFYRTSASKIDKKKHAAEFITKYGLSNE